MGVERVNLDFDKDLYIDEIGRISTQIGFNPNVHDMYFDLDDDSNKPIKFFVRLTTEAALITKMKSVRFCGFHVGMETTPSCYPYSALEEVLHLEVGLREYLEKQGHTVVNTEKTPAVSVMKESLRSDNGKGLAVFELQFNLEE